MLPHERANGQAQCRMLRASRRTNSHVRRLPRSNTLVFLLEG
jgi:hypothetical protein